MLSAPLITSSNTITVNDGTLQLSQPVALSGNVSGGATGILDLAGANLTGPTAFNGGTVRLSGGVLNGGGALANASRLEIAGGTVNLLGALNNAGQLVLLNDGAVQSASMSNTGIIQKTVGTGTSDIIAPLDNQGTVVVNSGTLNFAGGFSQSAGALSVGTGAIVSASGSSEIMVTGGVVGGTGDILGDLQHDGGTLSAGASPGTLTVIGDYTQGAGATMLVELAGTAAGEFDVLDVQGDIDLDGNLTVKFVDGFTGAANQEFHVLRYVGVQLTGSSEFATFSVPDNYGLSQAPDVEPLAVSEAPLMFAHLLTILSVPLAPVPPPVVGPTLPAEEPTIGENKQVIVLAKAAESSGSRPTTGESSAEEDEDSDATTSGTTITGDDEDGAGSGGKGTVLICS